MSSVLLVKYFTLLSIESFLLALKHTSCICAPHSNVDESIKPRCLCCVTCLTVSLLKIISGISVYCNLLNNMSLDLPALNLTFHVLAQCVILSKSRFNISAVSLLVFCHLQVEWCHQQKYKCHFLVLQ